MRRSEPGRPVARTTQSPALPRVNAIARPLGAQVGWESAGPEVKTRTSRAVAVE